MIGLTKITIRQKEMLRDLVRHVCEGCKGHEKEVGILQVHRMTRGNRGGAYIPSNIKLFCKECHKIMHQGEFGQWK